MRFDRSPSRRLSPRSPCSRWRSASAPTPRSSVCSTPRCCGRCRIRMLIASFWCGAGSPASACRTIGTGCRRRSSRILNPAATASPRSRRSTSTATTSPRARRRSTCRARRCRRRFSTCSAFVRRSAARSTRTTRSRAATVSCCSRMRSGRARLAATRRSSAARSASTASRARLPASCLRRSTIRPAPRSGGRWRSRPTISRRTIAAAMDCWSSRGSSRRCRSHRRHSCWNEGLASRSVSAS